MSGNAVLVFHADARSFYRQEWIDKFVESIRSQTIQDFTIVEIDYGVNPEGPIFKEAIYFQFHLPNHAEAQNWLLDYAFLLAPFDYAFNTNVDDYYHPRRIEVQLEYLRQGYDLVSTDFVTVDADDNTLNHGGKFSGTNVCEQLGMGHNIICHPVVAYSRNFWQGCSRYRGGEIPQEDLLLWQREMIRCKFGIVPEFLCYHRWHSNGVCER